MFSLVLLPKNMVVVVFAKILPQNENLLPDCASLIRAVYLLNKYNFHAFILNQTNKRIDMPIFKQSITEQKTNDFRPLNTQKQTAPNRS